MWQGLLFQSPVLLGDFFDFLPVFQNNFNLQNQTYAHSINSTTSNICFLLVSDHSSAVKDCIGSPSWCHTDSSTETLARIILFTYSRDRKLSHSRIKCLTCNQKIQESQFHNSNHVLFASQKYSCHLPNSSIKNFFITFSIEI